MGFVSTTALRTSASQLDISFVKQEVNRAGEKIDFYSCYFIRINVPGLQNSTVYTISNDESCTSISFCKFKIVAARFATTYPTLFLRNPYID